MEAAQLSERLTTVTREKIEKYEALRTGRQSCPFWDYIVLTATDADQAESYSKQLAAKRANSEIPDVKYYVFPDPPGPKIGNGGATMYALTKLEKLHGASLDTAKVLLIHAGGYSKRLPNVSVIGKIFAALPIGDPVYTMLEMKIASYIDFPEKMAPGVFVTCADDIELLDCGGDLDFRAPGFTALGHPSSVEIGTTHGVFVLDEASKTQAAKSGTGPACILGKCTRFLHKPSAEVMVEKGAVIPALGDQVYTDSAYYCDRATAILLQRFYAANAPLTCEIDAYGDFLQALGPASTDEYTRDASNVIAADDTLSATRLKLYNFLKKVPLNVILCNVSKFYHIGTIPEYIFHYCADRDFRAEMNCLPEAFVGYRTQSDDASDHSERAAALDNCCAIHSFLSPDVFIGSKSIVEYSDLGPSVVVGPGCVVSNVTIEDPADIPQRTFLHTTCTKRGYVTIVYGTGEDLKAGAKFDDIAAKLTYCNAPFSEVFTRLGCDPATFWDPEAGGKCTLWSAKIFPVFPTERDSIRYAIKTASVAAGHSTGLSPPIASLTLLSMEDILKAKDLSTILSAREALRMRILAARSPAPVSGGAEDADAGSGSLVVAVVAACVAISVAIAVKQYWG